MCDVVVNKIHSMKIPTKVGNIAWGILFVSNAYHGLSDASIFSISLPILPYEKCMTFFSNGSF